MPEVDPLIFQIRAETDQASVSIKRYADQVEGGMQRASASVDRASNVIDMSAERTSRSLGAVRMAGIGAGQQLQDMAVQFQGGSRASTILSQQLPQLSFALSGLTAATGKTAQTVGKFATFLSGPWGVAVSLAIIALGPLIDNITGTGDAADKAKPKVDALAESLSRLNSGQFSAVDVGNSQVLAEKTRAGIKRLDDQIAAAQQRADRFAATAGPEGGPALIILSRQVDALREQRTKLQTEYDGINATIGGAQIGLQKAQEREASLAATRDAKKASTKKNGKTDEERQNEAISQQIVMMQQQIQLDAMRGQGMEREADLLAARWEIERRFPEAGKEQVATAVLLAEQLVNQRAALEDIAHLHDSIFQSMKDAAQIKVDENWLKNVSDGASKALDGVLGIDREMDKALERVRDRGLYELSDGLADVVTGAENLGDVFSRVADSIIRDLIRISIQQAILGKGGGGGGLFGSILSGLGSIFGGRGISSGGSDFALGLGLAGARASGGPVSAGRTYLVGENGPELFTAPASGSIVPNHMLDTSAARGMVGASVAQPAAGVNGTIRVALTMDNDVFTARVQEASVPVAVEVYRQSAPGMVQAAKDATIQDLSRRRL